MTSQYQSAVLADAPYAYWRMNQTSGTTLTDSSGHSRPATLSSTGISYAQTGATTDGDTALGFDGTAGLATSTINTSSWGHLSIEFWAKQPTGGMSGANFAVCTQYAQNGLGWGVGFNAALGSMFFELGIGGSSYNYFGPSDTFTANTWYHIVVTYDGANVRTYINGVLKTTTAQTGALQAGDAGIWLATATDQGTYFLGSLDEVAIYNTTLSGARITAHYNAATAPAVTATLAGAGALVCAGVATTRIAIAHLTGAGSLGCGVAVQGRPAPTSNQYSNTVIADGAYVYWRMDEGTGTVLADSSGNNHAGTLAGSGIGYAIAGATTDGDTALSFDGSAGKATSSVDTSSWANLSVEFWVNQPTGGMGAAAYAVATQFMATNKGWGVGFNASLGTFFCKIGTGATYTSYGPAGTFIANTWYHIVVTYDGVNVKTYINSVLKSTTARSGALQAGDAGVWIATASDQSQFFTGSLDEVAIYATALSAARVLAHYQIGAYYQGVAALSGMALMGMVATATHNVVAHLTGAGALVSVGKVLLRPGVLSGSGTLTAKGSTTKHASATLVGAGTLVISYGLYSPLTLYATDALATTIPTAATMTASGGGASNSTQRTTIGTATGWGELHAHTTAAAWPALGAMPATAGYGLLYDSSALEGKQFIGGVWQPSIKLDCSNGSVIATLVAQACIYHGWSGLTSVIGTSTLTLQTINTTTATYSLPGVGLPYQNLGIGDKLYFAYFVNVTTNSTGSGAASLGWHDFAHAGILGLSTNAWIMPGYQAMTRQAVNAPLANPFSMSAMQLGGPYVVAQGNQLSYNGVALHALYGGTFYLNTEGGSPSWRTNIQALLLNIVQTFAATGLTILRPTDEWGSPSSGLNWDDPTIWTNLDYLIQQAYLAGRWVMMDISGWKTILTANGQNVTDATFWLPFIAALGNHLKYVPNIAWYSLVGEPNYPTDAGSSATLTAFYATITTAMNAADPNHLISAGGFQHMADGFPNWWQAIWQLPNVDICSFKTYSQTDVNNLVSYTQYAASLGKLVENNEFGMPQYMGDLTYNAAGGGYNGLAESRYSFYLQIFSQGQANGLDSYVFWNYDHGNAGLNNAVSEYDVDAVSSPYVWQLLQRTAQATPSPFVPATRPLSSLTTATVLALADSIAQHVTTLQAFVSVNASALVSGQITTLARIVALNDYSQVTALLDGFEASMLAETAFLARLASYNNVLDCYAAACIALDEATGGLDAYLTINNVQVLTSFADAFNRMQAQEGNGAQEISAAQSGASRASIY